MKYPKGQSGLEYIIIFAVLLAALTPIIIYSLGMYSVSIATAKSREVVQKIATEADNIYKIGGGKTVLALSIPPSVQSILIQNNTIRLRLKIGDGYGDAFAVTKANITGTFPIEEGTIYVPIQMVQNGTILIGNYS